MNLLKRDANRSIQLDFLRGIAILLVLGRHHPFIAGHKGVFNSFSLYWLRFGWTGVDLFFVLSGFLVGGLLFVEMKKRSTVSAGRFVVRRGFKIWPSYYVFLLYFLFFETYTGYRATFAGTVRKMIPHFLHYQNYKPILIGHIWSLAVEEHFYLLLPILLYLLAKRKKTSDPFSAVPLVAAFLCVFCLIGRIYTVYAGPLTFPRALIPTHLRVDGLFFGVMLAYFYRLKPEALAFIKNRRAIFLAIGVAMLIPMMKIPIDKSRFVHTVGFSMLYVGFGLILLVSVFSPADSGASGWFYRSWFARAIAFVGFHSYSIFLWHIEFGQKYTTTLLSLIPIDGVSAQWLWPISTTTFLALSIASGVAMSAIIERPFLAMRDKLFPSRSEPIPAQTPK